jgi:hypothetical protein
MQIPFKKVASHILITDIRKILTNIFRLFICRIKEDIFLYIKDSVIWPHGFWLFSMERSRAFILGDMIFYALPSCQTTNWFRSINACSFDDIPLWEKEIQYHIHNVAEKELNVLKWEKSSSNFIRYISTNFKYFLCLTIRVRWLQNKMFS